MELREKTKRRRTGEAKAGKPCCGTLRYLAECRGIGKKIHPAAWKKQVDGLARLERRYTTAG